MVGGVNQKILGAIVLGCALVAGAYTLSTFGEGKSLPAGVGQASAPDRVAIKVEDKDQNGIEDWRDTFLATEPIFLNTATSSYELPTTLTGRLSINFFQNYVNARTSGPIGRSNQELIDDTTSRVVTEVTDKIYDTRDVSILETWTDTDIKNYANTMGGILLNSKASPVENELYILKDVVVYGKKERLPELSAIATDYGMYRDESLDTPVPKLFLKQHLDLINVYNALHSDLRAMSVVNVDPVLALMHVKRYEDDALGLAMGLTNMNDELKPYSQLFNEGDPAVFFSTFDPNNARP